MRAITILTVAYLAMIAVIFSVFITSSGSKINDVALSEAIFALPMIISWFFGLFIRRVKGRRILLMFDFGFTLMTLLIIISTFTGEHDAQYQLALLLIPLIGFPAVIIAGVIAASVHKLSK